ncbi:type II toxin-antitoxin system Phd/YefM family antitoxin [Streptomyces sp. NPDC090106]|uniref:type II toxin-antitoxin system Phd/YefM family antitoxin n=1 Tax=Streptomyces sp. NPDC090106 TaxID=3365946 RepID=UPI003807613F
MRMYSTRQVQAKTKEILDAAAAGEEVRITRGKQVFKVVLVEGEQTDPLQATSTDDLLAELVQQSAQQTDLLRQLVEHKDTVLGDLIERAQSHQPTVVARPAKVTARVDEVVEARVVKIPMPPKPAPNPESEAATNVRLMQERLARRKAKTEELLASVRSRPASDESRPEEPQWTSERPAVAIPDVPEVLVPELPDEPSREELEAAYAYLGLRETDDGLEITETGIQNALGTVKKAARQDPKSAEATVMKMGPSDPDRIEFLRCVQLDKLSRALAKRAAGDRRWLGIATPSI